MLHSSRICWSDGFGLFSAQIFGKFIHFMHRLTSPDMPQICGGLWKSRLRWTLPGFSQDILYLSKLKVLTWLWLWCPNYNSSVITSCANVISLFGNPEWRHWTLVGQNFTLKFDCVDVPNALKLKQDWLRPEQHLIGVKRQICAPSQKHLFFNCTPKCRFAPLPNQRSGRPHLSPRPCYGLVKTTL